MFKKIKEFKWGYILLFIILLAAGVGFIVFKDALSTLAVVMGALIAIYGIFLATLALASKSRGARFAFKIIVSIAALIAGIITVFFRNGAMEIISSVICLVLIVDGSFKLQTTALSKRYSIIFWWFMLIPAVLSIAGGFIALRLSPSVANEEGMATVSVVIGITLIIDALANFLSSFYISKYENNMKEEIEYEVYAKIEEKRREEEALKAEEAAREEKREKKFLLFRKKK